jgi:hypothetical protein
VVSPRKLHRQLRLAHAAEATQHMYLLTLALILSWSRQQHAFELCHLCRPVYELARSRHTLKAKVGFVFSKV